MMFRRRETEKHLIKTYGKMNSKTKWTPEQQTDSNSFDAAEAWETMLSDLEKVTLNSGTLEGAKISPQHTAGTCAAIILIHLQTYYIQGIRFTYMKDSETEIVINWSLS